MKNINYLFERALVHKTKQNAYQSKNLYYKKLYYALLLTSMIGVSNAINSTVAQVINQVNFNKNSTKQKNYIHVNVSDNSQQNLLSNNDFESIKENVLKNNDKYLLDFTQSPYIASAKNDLKEQFFKSSAVSFNEDLILISRYKDQLMYTPTSPTDLEVSIKELDKLDVTKDALSLKIQNSDMPGVAFYINVIKNIEDQYCTFPGGFNNANWAKKPDPIYLCKNPHIGLIYRVHYARSLPFGGAGGTPDGKIVRISLDENSSGVGIALNEDGLKNVKLHWVPDFKDGGYTCMHQPCGHLRAVYIGSAIANSYKFDISASNNLANILIASPNNIMPQVKENLTSIAKFGIMPRLTLKPTSPSFSLNGTAEFTDTRSLSFDTQDYTVIKSTQNSQHVSFLWDRQNYINPDSIINMRTSDRWTHDTFPWNLNLIQPIAYKSFVPNLAVNYIANSDTIGLTTFTINSSITIKPLYSRSVMHPTGFWYDYSGIDDMANKYSKTLNIANSFNINWNHPVFLGGWPVNLRFNNIKGCINIEGGSIKSSQCDLKSISQSFMYDKEERYRSVQDLSLCLDAADLSKLNKCNSNVTQAWTWNNGQLINKYKNRTLAYNENGELSLFDSIEQVPTGYNHSLGTVFTDILND